MKATYEEALIGARAGTLAEAEIGTVRAKARVIKVLDPIKIETLEELRSLDIKNHYSVPDLERLYQDDIVLHYLVLREVPEENLAKTPLHFLAQLHNYTRLHRFRDVQRLVRLASKDKEALKSIGDILYSYGRYSEAASCYSASDLDKSKTIVKQARSFFLAGNLQKALELLGTVPDKETVPCQEASLGLSESH